MNMARKILIVDVTFIYYYMIIIQIGKNQQIDCLAPFQISNFLIFVQTWSCKVQIKHHTFEYYHGIKWGNSQNSTISDVLLDHAVQRIG